MDIWADRFKKIKLRCTNKVAHFKIGYKNQIAAKNKVISLVKTYDFLKRLIVKKTTSNVYVKNDFILNEWAILSKRVMDFTISHYQIYDYIAPEFDYASKINQIMKDMTKSINQLTNSKYYHKIAKSILRQINTVDKAATSNKKPEITQELFIMLQSNFVTPASNIKYKLCQSMLAELLHIFKTVYKKYKLSNNKTVRGKIKVLIRSIQKFESNHGYYHKSDCIKNQIKSVLKYDKSKFSALRYKCSFPIVEGVKINTTILLFNSGSMVNPGIKISYDPALDYSKRTPKMEEKYMAIFYQKFVEFMKDNNLFVVPHHKLDYKWRIVNTSYCFQLPFYSQKFGTKYTLNLTDLTAPSDYSEHIWYDPCMFPGETIAIPERREKFILYSSRKCILSGCKKESDTRKCMAYLQTIFKSINPPVKDFVDV